MVLMKLEVKGRTFDCQVVVAVVKSSVPLFETC